MRHHVYSRKPVCTFVVEATINVLNSMGIYSDARKKIGHRNINFN